MSPYTDYDPTEEDIQAYAADCQAQDSKPYELTHKGLTLKLMKAKNGDWIIRYYSPMSLNLAETVWRSKTATKSQGVEVVRNTARAWWKIEVE